MGGTSSVLHFASQRVTSIFIITVHIQRTQSLLSPTSITLQIVHIRPAAHPQPSMSIKLLANPGSGKICKLQRANQLRGLGWLQAGLGWAGGCNRQQEMGRWGIGKLITNLTLDLDNFQFDDCIDIINLTEYVSRDVGCSVAVCCVLDACL